MAPVFPAVDKASADRVSKHVSCDFTDSFIRSEDSVVEAALPQLSNSMLSCFCCYWSFESSYPVDNVCPLDWGNESMKVVRHDTPHQQIHRHIG